MAKTGGGSNLGFGLAFTLDDQFSGPANNIANSMTRLQGMANSLSGTMGGCVRNDGWKVG